MTHILTETQYLKSGVQNKTQRFQETGNVKDRPKHGSPKSDTNEVLAIDVLQYFLPNAHLSTRNVSQIIGLSQTSVCRVLHDSGFKAIKLLFIKRSNVCLA